MAIGIYKIWVSWKFWLFIYHIAGAWADSSHSLINSNLSLTVKSSAPDLVSSTESKKQNALSFSSALLTSRSNSSVFTQMLQSDSSHSLINSNLSLTVKSSAPDFVSSTESKKQNTLSFSSALLTSRSNSSVFTQVLQSDSSTIFVLPTTPRATVVVGSSKQNSQRPIIPVLTRSWSSSPSIFMPSSKSDLLTKFTLPTTTNAVSSSRYLQSSITRVLTNTPSSSSSIAQSLPKSTEISNRLTIIAVAAAGVFVFLVLIFILIFCWKRRGVRRRRTNENFSNYFPPALSAEELFNDLTDEDNLEPRVQIINIADEEEPKPIPLSFQGFPKTFDQFAATEIELAVHEDLSKSTADVISSNECSSSNESQNQGDSLLPKNIEHDLSPRSTGSSTFPEKEVILDVKNEQLYGTDTTLQTPAKNIADTCSPDVYRDSLEVLHTLDELLENESNSEIDPTMGQNISSGGEKTDNSNNEIDEQNCEQDFIVLYPFCASKTDEVTLTADAIVSVIESKPSGWSWVTNVDVGAGWFPSNYLEPFNSSLKRNEAKVESNLTHGELGTFSTPTNQGHLAEKDEGYLLPNEVLNGSKSSPDFVVVHSFFASNKDELTLEKGVVVSIIENRPSGWSWVTNTDFGTGWFPTNYLKPSDSSPTKKVIKSVDPNEILPIKEEKVSPDFAVLNSFSGSSTDELTLEKGVVVSVIENRPSGWSWVTNKDVGTGWFPTYYLKPLDLSTVVHETSTSELSDDVGQYVCVSHTPEDHGSTEEHQYIYARPDEVKEIKKEGNYEEYEAIAVQASHAYRSSKNNELSFKENETILVLEETDSGWWRGSTYCGEGWFPSTYVEVVAESQDEKSEDIDFTKDASNEYETIRNEIREEDISPYQMTDLISTKKQHFPDEDNPVKTKPQRAPPVPRVRRKNKEEIEGSMKLNEAEPEGIMLRTSSQSKNGLSKLIKVTKRRSIANSFQSNRKPPPQRAVPVAPPRQFRKQPKPSDLTTKNGEKIEKPRASRPPIMPRNGTNGDKINTEITHVPKRAPPPTPEKLEDFHARHKDRSQPTPPQGHANSKEDFNERKLDVNANNTSTKDNFDGIHLSKISEDQTEVNAGLHIQNQNTGTPPKPSPRKYTRSVSSLDKDDSDVQHSPNNEHIPFVSEDSVFIEHSPTLKNKANSTDLDETKSQPPKLVPRLHSLNQKDLQTTSPKTKNKTPEQVKTQQPQETPRSSSSTEKKSSTRKPLEDEPTNCTNISREIPTSQSSTEQSLLTNKEKNINTEQIPAYSPDEVTKVNSPTEESGQKEQPSHEPQSGKEGNTVCVGEESGRKTSYSSSSPKRENISRPTPRPRLKVKSNE